MRFKNDRQRKAVMAKFRLTRAFHPTAYEKDLWVVDFHVPGRPRLDRYTKRVMVKARSRSEAIKNARGI